MPRPIGLIHWKEVAEGWVGYAERTGSTFVIDPLSRFALDAIQAAPQGLTPTEIAAQLADVSDATVEPDLPERIALAVGILVSAQLIEISTVEPLPPQ
ncbi:hypothetical protein [Denitromonas iodatirespirans]|uniref:HPr-rel-A system PqqD family peptide chaperone n=1 Tax=Denitromonas iodatirespirans TaxID=2795389 RepID=A0A944DCF0_DENI1|nr:hypothetical protein [Denitromonas iodatirespirans]MBT0963929.1 hypothetical protein [Denitromonas iodatirespirans]